MKKAIVSLSISVLFGVQMIAAQSTSPDAGDQLLQGFKTGQFEISDYNTACYFALKGNTEAALIFLKKSVADGFSNSKTFIEDTDLSHLHNDPEWPLLVKQVKINELLKEKLDQAYFNRQSFWETKYFSTPFKENISDEEKIAGLSKLWSELKYNFVNFDLVPETDIDSLYFAYLPRIKQTKSTLEYYRLLTEMCAQLKDGHTNVYVPAELSNEVYARLPLRTRLIENKVFIIEVFDNQLVQKGIVPGTEIISIDNIPVKEYAKKYVQPYESSSTPQDLQVRTYEYMLLAGPLNKPVQLRVSDPKNRIRDVTVNRISPAERAKSMPNSPPFEYKMLPGNIAYVALNSFGNDSAAIQFRRNYEQISKAGAIIFDVRNNGGGNTGVGWYILRHIMDTTATVHRWYTRDYKPSYRAWDLSQETFGGVNSIRNHSDVDIYKKPVIVLTSAKTFSAAEDFAAAFKSLNRGIIIGEATGGSSGQPLMITLPGNGIARICTKRDQLADGEDFVGKGIIPHQSVLQTVSDYRKNIDTQLEAALKVLKK